MAVAKPWAFFISLFFLKASCNSCSLQYFPVRAVLAVAAPKHTAKLKIKIARRFCPNSSRSCPEIGRAVQAISRARCLAMSRNASSSGVFFPRHNAPISAGGKSFQRQRPDISRQAPFSAPPLKDRCPARWPHTSPSSRRNWPQWSETIPRRVPPASPGKFSSALPARAGRSAAR